MHSLAASQVKKATLGIAFISQSCLAGNPSPFTPLLLKWSRKDFNKKTPNELNSPPWFFSSCVIHFHLWERIYKVHIFCIAQSFQFMFRSIFHTSMPLVPAKDSKELLNSLPGFFSSFRRHNPCEKVWKIAEWMKERALDFFAVSFAWCLEQVLDLLLKERSSLNSTVSQRSIAFSTTFILTVNSW